MRKKRPVSIMDISRRNLTEESQKNLGTLISDVKMAMRGVPKGAIITPTAERGLLKIRNALLKAETNFLLNDKINQEVADINKFLRNHTSK